MPEITYYIDGRENTDVSPLVNSSLGKVIVILAAGVRYWNAIVPNIGHIIYVKLFLCRYLGTISHTKLLMVLTMSGIIFYSIFRRYRMFPQKKRLKAEVKKSLASRQCNFSRYIIFYYRRLVIDENMQIT